MKRTTYIMIGMILSGFIGILAYISLSYIFLEIPVSNRLVWKGEVKQLTFPASKVVKFVQPLYTDYFSGNDKQHNQVCLFDSTQVEVTSTSLNEIQFTMAEEMVSFVQSSVVADTTFIRIEVPADLYATYKLNPSAPMNIHSSTMKLELPAVVQGIEFEVNKLPVSLCAIDCDSMRIASTEEIQVIGGRYRSLFVPKAYCLRVMKGEIENLHIDLDGVVCWSVQAEQTRIKREILTGSRYHSNLMQPLECKELHWLPKNNRAILNLEIRERAVVTAVNEEWAQ